MRIDLEVEGNSPDDIRQRAIGMLLTFVRDRQEVEEAMNAEDAAISVRPIRTWGGEVAIWEADVTVYIRDVEVRVHTPEVE